jgi:flagellar M-ring protein FliF
VSDLSQGKTAASSLPSGYEQMLAYVKSKPMIPLLAAGAATVSILAGMIMWANAPEFRVMYSNINEADGGSIINELQKRNVPFKLSEDGKTLLVPSDQVSTLRLQLAEQGLPKAGNVGFELMDHQSFGVSEFAEQINFQRGLEGELARSIESLGPVASARVHLVMAKKSVFARDREASSASVVLNLRPGRELGAGQIEAITYMVSSSVPHLPAEAVSVVDQQGHLLSRPSRGGKDLDSTQLAYTDEIESGIRNRIETIVAPLVGANNVKATVTAQIDFANREQTAERYSPNQSPNQQAIRSQQLTENISGDAEFARGVPGALTNSPPSAPAITTPVGGQKPKANSKTAPTQAATTQAADEASKLAGKSGTVNSEKMINYELDRNIEHVTQSRGAVQRLSAAVVVNFKEVTAPDGTVTNVALTEDEMAGINRLVRQAMGFSATRGDEVAVINSAFNNTKETVVEVEWWKTPEFFNLATTISRNLLAMLAGLLLYFALVRPQLRKRTEAAQAVKAAEALAAERLAQDAPLAQQLVEDPTAGVLPVRRRKLTYEHNLKGFQAMASEDPHLVASVLRSWMSEAK